MSIFRIGVWGLALLAPPASTVSVDEAILSDIMTSFVGHEASTCITADTASSTSFTFNWPGSSDPTSKWYPPHVGFEEDLFQAAMSHDDGSGRRSWTIRIGTGGNMYSHYAPDLHGESMAPQAHGDAPWIDEVQQQVAVNNNLNNQAPWNRPYFHHQAGAYQRDGSYTTVPFYSPSFARHCAGNTCTFASWGTQAHVPTPFTAPVMFITRYTNCGSGVIELTQAMHNFADVASGTTVDQNYFNVGWGGVRASRLPFALEASSSEGSSTDSLDFANPDYVDTMGQCPWQVSHSSPGQMTNLDQTPGYTAFATSGLLSNDATLPELPCRDNSISCSTNVGGCMVTSCTDAQVSSGSHTRVALRVSPGSTPNCSSHSFTYTREGVTYPGMRCDLRDTGFGRNFANSCEPWARFGFKRMDTGAVLEVAYVKHWTWNSGDEDTFLAIYEEDAATARSTFNSFFDNTADTVNQLDIEVVLLTTTSPPADYNPGVTESAFTYVYGRGEDYSQLPSPNAGDGSVISTSRRRWGTSDRDYTVFTVNWLGQSRLKPGQTYINRSFQFASELGAVEALGEDLREKVYIDQVDEVDYNARRVDLYKDGDKFEAVAASVVGGSSSCGSETATVSCSGWSTPQAGKSPFFYITCGANTHVGQDPYHFSPSFGGTFPGHAPVGGTVRSYVCDGQPNTVRPTWKLLGFFSPGDCAGIESATLDEFVCPDNASGVVVPPHLGGPGSADFMTGGAADIQYAGVGRPMDANGVYYNEETRDIWYAPGTPDTGMSQITSSPGPYTNTPQGCKTYCETQITAGGNAVYSNLVGFSWYDATQGNPARPADNNYCTCFKRDGTTAGDTIGSFDGGYGAAGTTNRRLQSSPGQQYGFVYCYACSTDAPSNQPSVSGQPSGQPSVSAVPTVQPSAPPSSIPSEVPSSQPSAIPSSAPSSVPSEAPSGQPSSAPSQMPSSMPSESPSSNPSQGCDNIRTDCGWGIFNPWTCQCDCPVGICRDNNGYCLNPCQDTINVNPFAGCAPGWDCPWHPSNDGYCKSEIHIPNVFEIYRSAKDCCQEHYGGSAQCVTDSTTLGANSRSSEFPDTSNYYAPVEADNAWQTEQGQEPKWFPDLYNKRNCVYGSNYESWMNEEDFKDNYLSKTSARCCDNWFSDKGTGCPDPGSAVNPEAEDEALSGGLVAYYFPEFDKNNCGFGIDYPAWMGVNGYEKHYLYTSGQECCDRYFEGVGGCPHETTHEGGYFWSQYEDELPNDQAMPAVYNHTYYPLMERGTCVNGTDYPDWMAIDDDYRRMYLFKDLEGCCQQWFSDFDVQGCVGSVVQGFYDYVPCVENRDDSGCVETSSVTNTTAHQLTMFYPRLGSNTCGNDGDMPSWMLSEDYAEYYLYSTMSQCCAAFGFSCG